MLRQFKVQNLSMCCIHIRDKIITLFWIGFLFYLHKNSLGVKTPLFMRFLLLQILKSPSGELCNLIVSFESRTFLLAKGLWFHWPQKMTEKRVWKPWDGNHGRTLQMPRKWRAAFNQSPTNVQTHNLCFKAAAMKVKLIRVTCSKWIFLTNQPPPNPVTKDLKHLLGFSSPFAWSSGWPGWGLVSLGQPPPDALGVAGSWPANSMSRLLQESPACMPGDDRDLGDSCKASGPHTNLCPVLSQLERATGKLKSKGQETRLNLLRSVKVWIRQAQRQRKKSIFATCQHHSPWEWLLTNLFISSLTFWMVVY